MDESDKRIKLIVQRRIVFVSVLIFIVKIGAYHLTNSVGILTDALESTVNVMTGFISLYTISIALKPSDIDHPFGHGKIELISASIEGILIVLAGLFIIYEALTRLFNPYEIEQLDIGILIVVLAGLLNYVLGYYSIKTGRKYKSIALIAGGKHLQSDTYSSIGLVVGLVLLLVTKKVWLDSAIAILFGSIIIYTGYKILRETTSNLMDEADFNLLKEISNVLRKNKNENWIDVSNLKLLKYGDAYHIDCDLTLPRYMNIVEAHREGDFVEQKISEQYPFAIDFTIHTDVCTQEMCKHCTICNCELRTQSFQKERIWTVEKILKQATS